MKECSASGTLLEGPLEGIHSIFMVFETFFFQSLFYLMYFISYLKCFLDCIEKTKMFVAPVSDTVLLTQLMFNTGLLNYRFM